MDRNGWKQRGTEGNGREWMGIEKKTMDGIEKEGEQKRMEGNGWEGRGM
jgi:hypothetical protein